MRTPSLLAVACLLAVAPLAVAAEEPARSPAAAPSDAPARPVDEEAAKRAAEQAGRAWLGIIDSGDYAASWKAAGTTFRDNVSLADWVGAMKSVSDATGLLAARELASATYTEKVPGVVGAFVILQFRSRFEKMADAREIVTLQREDGGVWRLAGYFVRRPGAAP